jgi:hypothetical protein
MGYKPTSTYRYIVYLPGLKKFGPTKSGEKRLHPAAPVSKEIGK